VPDGGKTHLLDLDVATFKAEAFSKLAINNLLIAAVGDRLDDFRAATAANVPAIVLSTTLSWETLSSLELEPNVGLVICTGWTEVDAALERFQAGSEEMKHLRQVYAEQYAGWLKNLNDKSGILAAMSAAVAGLSGKLLIDQRQGLMPWEGLLISAALLSSMMALLYSIQAFTSRHSSGRETAQPIAIRLRQSVAFLLGVPKGWRRIAGDPIDEYLALRNQAPQEQAHAHRRFFFEKYGTHDPEALLNFRLFEMRALNYDKLYPERIGSQLLRFAILLLSLWVSIVGWTTITARSSPPGVDAPQGGSMPPPAAVTEAEGVRRDR